MQVGSEADNLALETSVKECFQVAKHECPSVGSIGSWESKVSWWCSMKL